MTLQYRLEYYMRRAFTLAELMIAMVVIGIITAILLPVAINALPNEDVMKFKKGHNTLYTVISELVTSDKYYKDGDLGITSNGVQIHSRADSSYTLNAYFCQTFADVVSAKKVDCKVEYTGSAIAFAMTSDEILTNIATGVQMSRTVTGTTINATKEKFDRVCKTNASVMKEEIKTTDDIVYYPSSTAGNFGASDTKNKDGLQFILRYFSPPNQHPANYSDQYGNDIVYKIFCMDIDGIPDEATSTNCVNECPFGYGIRADGKILNGTRAEEWLAKSLHSKE